MSCAHLDIPTEADTNTFYSASEFQLASLARSQIYVMEEDLGHNAFRGEASGKWCPVLCLRDKQRNFPEICN